ncbi:AAA family ATPase [Flavobacterium sp. HBTb2-11-1]|uniref:AAA family ATPase n=1 Tax=Flavobacterium sp. HBTb2-11-1 TaxID=2692212 RepID=UPI001368F5B8|nr:AAA family ATPase [Flavobacterium sp. HBTb2-11-1]MXO05366.1 AAA family ATPase [Flavobacterium sp. HBTb2-11-1]
MITNIKLKGISSYKNEVIIDDLKKVNFFFGKNGSGKSTIAKFLYNLSLEEILRSTDFNNCSQTGYLDDNYEILVFDEKFTEKNFIKKDIQNGIFSLNQGNETIDTLIENENIFLQQNIDYLKDILQPKKDKIIQDDKVNFDKLKKECFEDRKNALQFFLKIKDSFPYKQIQNNFDKILNVLSNPLSNDNITFEDLINAYKRYFDNEFVKINSNISRELYSKIRKQEVELNKLLNEVIIGNNDVDIAKMINDLGIRNWVSTGISFLKQDEDLQICPFCQKETVDAELIDKFENYFDENYKNKISELEKLKTDYISNTSLFLQELKSILGEFNEKNIVSNLYDSIKTFFDENVEQIDLKIKDSNVRKEIKSLVNFKNEISNIKKIIKKHNDDFNNIDSNRKQFEIDLWCYLARESKEKINEYHIEKYNCAIDYFFELDAENYINSLISESKEKIEQWKTETVTTQEAISNINTILVNSGFDGFLIDEKEKVNNISQYYLKRIDDENSNNVFKTLSEGEKNFISFLYFYQLCLGTDSIDRSSKKKIIVIDDPVSSLDSQVLFIVTTLVHQLIAKKGNSPDHLMLKNPNIQQVFILSHNIYFFKEVSLYYRPICHDKTFFHITKIKNISGVSCTGSKNEILDDYTLLWNSLKSLRIKNDSELNISVCNIMRRILESYVNFTGLGKDSWDFFSTIPVTDPKYYIFSALMSEINDGSHKISALDNIFYQRVLNEVPQNLFTAFEMIFREIAEPHYNAMMN